jgi:antitoxin component of RelBE/YafQ-DinJ toxin-antitoxin module
MILQGYGMPIDLALQLLSQYIYERKSVPIKIIPPRTPKEIKLFELMFGVVCRYYNIQF